MLVLVLVLVVVLMLVVEGGLENGVDRWGGGSWGSYGSVVVVKLRECSG